MSLAAGLSLGFTGRQASTMLLKYSGIRSDNRGRVTGSMCRMRLTVAVSERMDHIIHLTRPPLPLAGRGLRLMCRNQITTRTDGMAEDKLESVMIQVPPMECLIEVILHQTCKQ